MASFLGELDRFVLVALVCGLVLGVVWWLAVGIGMPLASLVLAIAAVLLAIRYRWVEIATFALGIGIVPAVLYRLFGEPAIPPAVGDAIVIRVEAMAPALADGLVAVSLVMLLAVLAIDARVRGRRARHAAAHEARRRDRLAGALTTARPGWTMRAWSFRGRSATSPRSSPSACRRGRC